MILMKEYFLNYYPKFKCIAGDCKHTCCAGWEMNIDEKMLALYKKDESLFSATLKQGVDFDKSCFKADKKGRCAFLNEKGLCEIIINLGEDHLCQVCRDHPHFRSFSADRVETGLGFCCEQVAKIVLSFQDKIQLVLKNDDNQNEPLDFIQKSVLSFRQTVVNLLQDRNIPINDRIQKVVNLCYAELSPQNNKKIVKTFLSLERLNDGWESRLKSIKKAFDAHTDEKYSLYCEQFLVNSVYRHLLDAEDTTWVRAITLACVYSWLIVKNVVEAEDEKDALSFDLLVDVVREFSAEVEYSQDNLDKLFSACYKLIRR